MSQPPLRFSVRRLMIVVAVMGLAFASYRFLVELSYSTHHGPNTSVLPLGLEVRIVEGVRSGESTIPAGTRGVVVYDPPDEDSAYFYRLVGVRISEGPSSGTTIDIKRTSLRAR